MATIKNHRISAITGQIVPWYEAWRTVRHVANQAHQLGRSDVVQAAAMVLRKDMIPTAARRSWEILTDFAKTLPPLTQF